jgi:transposase
MTGKTRRNLTDEFKAATGALLKRSGRPLSQAVQELGIEQSALRTRRRKLRPPGVQSLRSAAPAGNGHAAVLPAMTADQAGIRGLRRAAGARADGAGHLRKAVGIFSGPTRRGSASLTSTAAPSPSGLCARDSRSSRPATTPSADVPRAAGRPPTENCSATSAPCPRQ